jgi:hypothetical protein
VRKGDLYKDIMSVLLARIEAAKRTPARPEPEAP